jgi:hypothetical protein
MVLSTIAKTYTMDERDRKILTAMVMNLESFLNDANKKTQGQTVNTGNVKAVKVEMIVEVQS